MSLVRYTAEHRDITCDDTFNKAAEAERHAQNCGWYVKWEQQRKQERAACGVSPTTPEQVSRT